MAHRETSKEAQILMGTFNPKGEWLDYQCEESVNGPKFEFILYDGPQPDEHPSDVMHMLITDADGNRRGWVMNVEDAMIIIRGLSRLVDNALMVGAMISIHYEDVRKETIE